MHVICQPLMLIRYLIGRKKQILGKHAVTSLCQICNLISNLFIVVYELKVMFNKHRIYVYSKINFTKAYQEYSDEFEKAAYMKRKVQEKKAATNIV